MNERLLQVVLVTSRMAQAIGQRAHKASGEILGDALEQEPLTVTPSVQSSLPLVRGHFSVLDTNPEHSQWATDDQQQLPEDVQRGECEEEEEPQVNHRKDLFIQHVQRQQAQGLQVLDRSGGAHVEELALGQPWKDTGAVRKPSLVVE